MPATFGGLGQWSFFFRLSKQIHWGKALPAEGLDRYTAERIPITGIVSGEVYELTSGGKRPVAGIPVTVDGSRASLSNASGGYRIEGVPEGPHEVALQLMELPANFEPGGNSAQTVVVSLRRTTRLDFELIRLSEVCGVFLDAPDPQALGNLVIHLRPTTRYTTPEPDGSFCFHNLRPGSYTVELDTIALPPLSRLSGLASVPVRLDLDKPPGLIEFRLIEDTKTKPVRKKSLQEEPQPVPRKVQQGLPGGGEGRQL